MVAIKLGDLVEVFTPKRTYTGTFREWCDIEGFIVIEGDKGVHYINMEMVGSVTVLEKLTVTK